MLHILRNKKTAKQILIIIAVLIVPAFVLWGAGSAIRDAKGRSHAGIMFGKKITWDKYLSAFNKIRLNLSRVFGTQLPQSIIDQMTWERLILLYQARKHNLHITDSELFNYIKSIPNFQQNGHFSSELYKRTVGRQAKEFENDLKEDLLIEKLKQIISAKVTILPDELRQAYNNRYKKFNIAYTEITSHPSAVTEEEIKSEAKSNSTSQKESLKLQAEEVKAKILNLLDSSSDKTFEQALQELSLPIKTCSPFSMQSVYAKNNTPAKEHSDNPDDSNKTETTKKSNIDRVISNAVFNLEKGELSDIIETSDGYVIAYVKNIILPTEEEFQTAKEEFSKEFLSQKQNAVFSNWLQQTKAQANLVSYVEFEKEK